ncbi:MAG: pyridoxamine 5'-phosphate oxidase family protein [Dehalococcoidia bacterium]
MSQEQRWSFLERHHEIAVSTVNRDGVIYSSPVWYTVKDKRIYLGIDQASHHLKNTEGGSSMTGVVFDGGNDLATARGVQIQGRGEVLEDKELAKECDERIADSIFGPGHPHIESYREYRNYYDHLIIELKPEKMITWDMRKLYHLQVYTSRKL